LNIIHTFVNNVIGPNYSAIKSAILTSALREPEAVADARESGHGDVDSEQVVRWNPDEQKDEKSQLKDRGDADERLPRHSTSLGVV